MIDWVAFSNGISLLATWQMPLMILLGMVIGLTLGVVPGLTSAIGIALLLPVTYVMDTFSALVLLTSVYTGGLTGGGITAILINAPGAPGAVATTFDGYPMTKKGLANEALGLQITSSVIGGLLSYILLFFFIHPIVKLALQFGPSEMVFLTIFVIVVMGAIRGQSFSRTVFIGVFGLLLGSIGTCERTGVVRGTFGFFALEDGLPQVIVIVGLFAIPELFNLVTRVFISEESITRANDLKRIFRGVKDTFRYKRTILRSTLIGAAIGTLPAAGSTIACLLSYGQAKRNAKPHQIYGEGEPEGVVAAETSNNASEGGAMGTLLALGLPGSASTAILIAAFMLHGLMPGARLFADNAPLVYALIVSNIFQMLFLFGVATTFAIFLSRVVFVPNSILTPILLVVMTIGAFSVRYLFFDVYLLFFVGVIGWFLTKYDFPVTSLIIGYLLGQGLESELYRFSVSFGWDPSVLIERPISGCLFALTVLTIGIQIRRSILERKAR